MFVEHAELTVAPEQAEEFEAAFARGREALAEAEGCRWSELLRGVERPSTWLLLVGWDSVEAHTVGFRQSEGFTRWRAAVGPFFAAEPTVQHFDTRVRR